MKFSECKMGELVVCEGDKHEVGHIVGLTVNYEFEQQANRGEVIPLVQFVNSRIPRGIHYNNIRIVKNGETFTG